MKEKKKHGKKVVLVLVLLVILFVAGYFTYRWYMSKGEDVISLGSELINKEEEKKEPKTFAGNDRAIAVMIDNHRGALPQAGLNDAYMVYEIIVEGGESRLMALFKGVDVDKIGPVRSSRHYYLDYALENDAIYTHYGWSPQAESDISSLGVNNINGITQEYNDFPRSREKSSPHNVITTTASIKKIAEQKGYRTTSDTSSILKYSPDPVNLEEGQIADTVIIPYSEGNTVKYEYDKETERYIRYSRGKKQTDWDSGETITTKNIIITFARNTTLRDGENKGRQTLYNVGSLDGYYITNGKAIKIKCDKTSRASKTMYTDLDGNIIDVNDGNTFIQICPIDANVEINQNEQVVE